MNITHEAHQKLRRFSLEAKSIIQISIGVLILVIVLTVIFARISTVHHQASADATAKVNALGCQLELLIDGQVSRGEKSVAATLIAPASTAEQKVTAVRNLAGLKQFQSDTHSKLMKANITCPKPSKHRTVSVP